MSGAFLVSALLARNMLEASSSTSLVNMLVAKRKKSSSTIFPEVSVKSENGESESRGHFSDWKSETSEFENEISVKTSGSQSVVSKTPSLAQGTEQGALETPIFDLEQEFIGAVQRALINIDDTLDSMLADSWEAFKSFMPTRALRKTFGGRYSNSTLYCSQEQRQKASTKGPPQEAAQGQGSWTKMSTHEATSRHADFILMTSILSDPNMTPYIRSSQGQLDEMAESLTLAIKILKTRVDALKTFHREVRAIHQSLARKYSKSVSHAKALMKDYIKFSSPVVQSSPYAGNNATFLFYSPTFKLYSVIYRSEVKDDDVSCQLLSDVENKDKRKSVFDGILTQMNETLQVVHAVAKGSLNRTYRVMTSQDGQDNHCIKMEIMNLQDLFKNKTIRLHEPTTTTFLFSLMRILEKFDLLETVLHKGIKNLKRTEHQFLKKKKVWMKMLKETPAAASQPDESESDQNIGNIITKLLESNSVPMKDYQALSSSFTTLPNS